jgi:hypothetical protein
MAYLFTLLVLLPALLVLLRMAWELRLFRWAVPATMLYTVVHIIVSAS